MGYISSELSADETRNLYSQGEISEAKARHLSSNAFDPYGRGHHCVYNGSGQKGYWGDDRWHTVEDDD
jgi:hypothetical protein